MGMGMRVEVERIGCRTRQEGGKGRDRRQRKGQGREGGEKRRRRVGEEAGGG